MHIIDSHCHLDFEEFDQDFDEVINRARENNIKGMQTICTKISNFKKILEIAHKQKNIWCSIGNHPHNTEDEKISFDDIHHFCNSLIVFSNFSLKGIKLLCLVMLMIFCFLIFLFLLIISST